MISETVATRAQEICAHLLIFPNLHRDKYRDLMLDEDLRAEVSRRLEGVGMRLAESFYSDYFSVRPIPAIEGDVRFDWASNQRLPRGAMAMLVVLWAKLVMPRRAASDQRINPNDPNIELFPDQHKPKDYVVKVPREALIAEFEERFGRTNLARYLGQLKRLGFIREDRSSRLYEGPLLDLLVDGNKLAQEIQAGALRDMLGADVPIEYARNTTEFEPTSEEPLLADLLTGDSQEESDELEQLTSDDQDEDA